MSAYEHEGRREVTSSALAADFIATFAIFAGFLSIVYTPGLLGTAAVVAAIFAVTIGGRDRWLAPFAVFVTGVCWVVGMALAVLLERPIF